MDRPTTTKLLTNLMHLKFNANDYYASEVTINKGQKGKECRVDFMKFEPLNHSQSGIEKGEFYAYEVKSSLADFNSPHGHNFIADRNYYVMPMAVYAKVVNSIPHHVGVYAPIPHASNKFEEFNNPTKLVDDVDLYDLKCIKHAHLQDRAISSLMLLVMMFRSG